MRLTSFVSSVLAYSVYCSPLLLREGPSEIQSISAANATGSHGHSILASPPGGPASFRAEIEEQFAPINENDCLLSGLLLVRQLARDDWNGGLPNARTIFQDPKFPSLIIVVRAILPQIERRWVIWGVARVLDYMVQNDRFLASHIGLYWLGSKVGLLSFIATAPNDQAYTGYKTITLTESLDMKATNDTVAIGVRQQQIGFRVHFHGDVMPRKDIFMGTLAAVVRVAPYRDRTYNTFAAGWPWTEGHPSYKVCQAWLKNGEGPSRLTQAFLIQAMVTSVWFAVQRRDFRELELVMILNGERIADGGYFKCPLPDPDEVGTSVASS